MAIKQLWLFEPAESKHNLEQAQKLHDEKVSVTWGPPDMAEADLRRLDYINHLKDRLQYIEGQEKELSDSIADGWKVVTSYAMGDGMRGCYLVLYKPDKPDEDRSLTFDVSSSPEVIEAIRLEAFKSAGKSGYMKS